MKPGQDGVTRVLYRLVDYLNEKNIPNIFFSSIIPKNEDQPSPMIKVPSLAIPFYKEYRMAIPKQKFLKRQINDFEPNIIHINSPCSLGYSAVRFAKKNFIPAVATYHTHFPSYAKYYKVRTLETFGWSYIRKLYNNCERVYVPSIPILNELDRQGINNLKFLPHGVDIQTFNPKYKDNHWRKTFEGKSILLYIGRLVWEKDLKDLADAYQILLNKRRDFTLILVGDGPIKKDLEKLMPKAVFLGYKTGLELSKIYTTETFGNVTLEAMASGLTPICANKGGAAGFIKDFDTGLLSKPNDPINLAEKIELILNNYELKNKISNNALSYARTQTWVDIFDRLIESYYEVADDFKWMAMYRTKVA
jgi:glycosyltransferase involved in cell wall biosynthesis